MAPESSMSHRCVLPSAISVFFQNSIGKAACNYWKWGIASALYFIFGKHIQLERNSPCPKMQSVNKTILIRAFEARSVGRAVCLERQGCSAFASAVWASQVSFSLGLQGNIWWNVLGSRTSTRNHCPIRTIGLSDVAKECVLP